MWEQSKAAKRRFHDGNFLTRYFVGHGIDIGGAPDPLGQYVRVFPLMLSVRTWDMADGDAQFMSGVEDNSIDFVHASHCLEHMVDVREALINWIRITKPGGFIIITVPDEVLYEHEKWPSAYNSDHKWSFSVCNLQSTMPNSIAAVELAREFAHSVNLERLIQINDFYRPVLADLDQTLTPVAECAIEIVWQKK